MKITDFQEVRRDGKILLHPFDATTFSKLGWTPDTTIELRWQFANRTVSIAAKHGATPVIVAGGHFVAALIQRAPDPSQGEDLVVFNGDGTLRLTLPGEAPTPVGPQAVKWVAFENVRTSSDDHFGAIADVGDGQWAYVVNAVTGDLTFRGESR